MICKHLQKVVITSKQYEFTKNKPCQINEFTQKVSL